MTTPIATETPRPVAYCRLCGKPVFAATPEQVASGQVYCDVHATAASPYAAAPAASPYVLPPGPVVSGVSPGLAFVLGFLLPGVGAVYNGQYVKGFAHALVFGVLVSLLGVNDTGAFAPLLGILVAVWIFYMAFEAYHTARKRQRGEALDEFSGLMPMRGDHARSPVGPVVLIAIGVMALLINLDLIHLSQILRFWPVFLIALGVYLLYTRMNGAGTREVGAAAEVSHDRP